MTVSSGELDMTPAGYMAKRVYKKDKRLKDCTKKVFLEAAPQVIDVYYVSNCISENFTPIAYFSLLTTPKQILTTEYLRVPSRGHTEYFRCIR